MGVFKEYLREQQLDELSKKTLASYTKKATTQVAHHAAAGAKVPAGPQQAHAQKYHKERLKKRTAGIKKAVANLKKPPPKPKPAKKPAKKGKSHDWAKHGVTANVSHLISSGLKHGAKAIIKRVVGGKH